MKEGPLDKLGWVYTFNKITMFVTTFAPFYPENHSRYAYESNNGYILFQPEVSFARKNLANDTPKTNWSNPKTVRDKIRVAFKDAGRPYRIRETIYYPTSWEIVKSPDDCGDNEEELVVKWWEQEE